jgi:hypothetical protein
MNAQEVAKPVTPVPHRVRDRLPPELITQEKYRIPTAI